MKMLSARQEAQPYSNQLHVPRTDFVQSSKTQMMSLKDNSQSKLSSSSAHRHLSSDKNQLATLRTTTQKKTLEKIPLE